MDKPKLNQPDVEITTTVFNSDTEESITINKTIPSKQFKDIFVTGTTVQYGPTIEEVKKEWEELGWSWFMDKICIKLTNKEDNEIEIHIWLKDIEYTKAYKEFYQYITLQEHQLLTKTFKTLGWEV